MNLKSFNTALEEAAEAGVYLKVLFRGLALNHFDEASGEWKIFFPKAPNHILKMTVIKRTADGDIVREQTFEFDPATKIEITTDGKTGGGEGFDAGSLQVISDLSDLHGEPLPLKNEKELYAGFLTIHSAKIRAKKDAPVLDFEVWRVAPFPLPTGKSLIARQPAASMSECILPFGPGSETKIRVESEISYDVVLTLEEGFVYQIDFDNDCHMGDLFCDPDDFKFYYNIIDEELLKTPQRIEVLPFSTDNKAPRGSCLPGGGRSLIIPNNIKF